MHSIRIVPHLLYLLVLTCLFFSCNKNTSREFIVKGVDFEELEGQKLYLWKIKETIVPEEQPIDSTFITNGTFEFRGKEDTLHMYYIDESIRFFPERGTNLIDPVAPCRKCTSRNQKYWELSKTGLPPSKESYRFMKENIGNALGVFMFDRLTGIEPGDLKELYGRSNENMRSYFPLNAIKKQLDTTPDLIPGSPFIDFDQTDLKGNPVRLSQIAGQGTYTCLIFLLNMAEKEYVAFQVENLSKDYPGLQTIIFSNFNPAPAEKQFEAEMQAKPGVYWIYDNRRYEESVQYRYRLRGPINYLVLISPEGKVMETKTLREDSSFALTLYNELQDDETLKSALYSKAEQDRAKETVKKYKV